MTVDEVQHRFCIIHHLLLSWFVCREQWNKFIQIFFGFLEFNFCFFYICFHGIGTLTIIQRTQTVKCIYELVSSGANCDHHHHEEGHSCGSHEEGHSCGDSCGSGCGGCSGSQPQLTGRNVGKTCRTHYRGTFNDGTQFDSSYDRGEPLEFICGAGQMIRGFDAAVADMEVGQIIDVHLMPEEAYGMADPNAIFTMEIAQLPGSEDLTVGQQVYLSNQFGQPFPVKVTAKDEKNITFDANHEMAGKELNFKIELVEVK